MKNLVFESLDELFENKKAQQKKEDKTKLANISTSKAKLEKSKELKFEQNKIEKAKQAINALKKELTKAKKPGAFKTLTAKNAKIKELENKIKAWEKKLK